MNDINKKENIAIEVEKGQAAFRQAKILYESKEYDGSISRAYYAVFHYTTALLLTKGFETRSHEGLGRLFNLHFIKTNVFPKKYSTILSHMQKAREESDYQPEVPFTEEDAKTRLKEAEEFVTCIEKFLKEQHYLQI